jgi:hypothetical protein
VMMDLEIGGKLFDSKHIIVMVFVCVFEHLG